MRDPRRKAGRLIAGISAVYFVVGVLWILVTDWVVLQVTVDPQEIAYLQNLKGWLFIVLSTALIYGLLRYSVVRLYAARQETRAARNVTGQVIDALPAEVAMLDGDGQIVGVNEGWRRFAQENGYPYTDRGVGHNYFDACERGSDREGVEIGQGIRAVAARDLQQFEAEYQCPVPTGQRWYRVFAAPLDDRPGGTVVMHVDVTAQREAEGELRLVAKALQNTADGILIADANFNVVFVNSAFTRITGYSFEEAVQHVFDDAVPVPGYDEALVINIEQTLKHKGYWQGEMWERRRNGEVFPALISMSTVKDDEGWASHYVVVFNDVSQSKHYERRLEFLAHHDPLTQLPNRILLLQRLRDAVVRARRHGTGLAVLFVDLDQFKTINDSLGHDAGDALLQCVGTRFAATVRETDTVARLGGDEFAVLLDGIKTSSDAALVSEKLRRALAEPIAYHEHQLHTSASIGISSYPETGRDAETLLKNADVAMYRAKARGRNTYQFFSGELSAHAFETLMITNSLYQALERDEFRLNFQAYIDLETGRVTGAEALLRWRHPTLGMVSPSRFIPVAEKIGVIIPIGHWVLRAACEQAVQWRRLGRDGLRVGVNLSPIQFRQADLPSSVAAVLEETGLPGAGLMLEITETAMVEEPTRTETILRQLHELGVTIAVDDFGTGYSSLGYLKHLPIDALKIDRSFVSGLPGDGDDVVITRTIMAMARSLNLELVAEGVETEAQWHFLRREGCREGQGYLFSMPLAADDFQWLLQGGSELTVRRGP